MSKDRLSIEETPTSSPAAPSRARLHLPDAPPAARGPVKAWTEPVDILTYLPADPDPNPLFLEHRVYQGSTGRVYPLPVIDRIETRPETHSWKAVHLENEFLRLMILPDIGGRIHIGVDKRTGYDFFYRQNVIKPALVGLAGPWISGGVEFNWPQHHRPATFMPMEFAIERDPDGSVTVWCSDHDPMVRMKGMHGICLRPGKAFVEVKVRLYNRTVDTQTFLWWANVATRVHEKYQSFFPPDVRFAADHAKRAVTEYPLSQGVYYGIDYGQRARTGVPLQERPSHFVPDGSYAPNDLGWYANIPVPTSYMIAGSRGDFFGGYDHAAQAGTVAVANHHISPGKKQWTWGNHEFGYAWDRSLTDSDGPYVELMSGVYTDNQPDFSFLAPGETKTFSQFWYPIGAIGVPNLASVDGALRVECGGGGTTVHVQTTSARPDSAIVISRDGVELERWTGDLSPEAPAHVPFRVEAPVDSLEVRVEQNGEVVLRYAAAEVEPVDRPEVATEPPLPEDVPSSDELYLNGVHLEQYRHPTRGPEPYWLEALRRDPGDSRANSALGRWHLRRGEFDRAEEYLRTCIGRLTRRNPNPSEGEPHYNLGLTMLFQGHIGKAYDAFYKSTWNAGWRGPAFHRLAEIDLGRSEWSKALDHLDRSLRADADNLNVLNLKAIALQRLGREDEARTVLSQVNTLDPLDTTSRYLLSGAAAGDAQQQLDLAFDFLRAGLLEDALKVLAQDRPSHHDGAATLRLYLRADILRRMGRSTEASHAWKRAATADPRFVFPSRLDELLLLQTAMQENPADAHAPFYLGNLLYDRRRHHEAIQAWERAVELDPSFPTAWRNLGFACFNVLHEPARARAAFARARELAPNDARILYEEDQLLKRLGAPLADRLATLVAHRSLVERRDDLSVELATLFNSTGEPEQALALLLGRTFGPWEGGEGQVLTQYIRANVLLAQRELRLGHAQTAVTLMQAAGNPPLNLSEAKHLLLNLSMVDFWLGVALASCGEHVQANGRWQRAAAQTGDFQQMQVQTISETTYWSAMSLRRLGREREATDLFQAIDAYASALEQQVPKIDYFATSLPAMLLFHEDLKERQDTNARFLHAQAQLGLGHRATGLRLLEDVLARDHSHTGATDLLASTLTDEG